MKKNLKTLLALLLVVTLAVAAFFIFRQEKQTTVGILQFVQHPALDAARDGFLEGLKEAGFEDGKNVKINYQNGQASQDICASIADKFLADKVDMALGIATPAVLALAGKSETLPILGTAVTDYVEAKLVQSNEKPGLNVSGTTDMNPVEEQIALILRFLPEAKVIGLLYTGSEVNSQIQAKLAKSEIGRLGLQVVEVTVSNSNDVQQAVLSLVDHVDAIYVPTDNIIASAIPVVAEAALKAGIPIACGEAGQVNSGGTFTLGIDYFKLGKQTGTMAAEVLRNKTKVGEMPIQRLSEFEFLINKTYCDAIGLPIPQELLPYAVDVDV
ncbi:MAG: ABC transporter substrate-binding protein [Clostridiales bacterium]|nr:ABC transporter substrate-binding protein [Clostridiales bacterium]